MARHAKRVNTVVIGGGQAGLSVGYHLARLGVRFVILDASTRVGDTWRNRWDSLRLFTPARHAGLDGLPFPGAALLLPDQGRNGRLPGGVRATLRAAGRLGRPRRTAVAARRAVPRRRRPAALRRRQRRRRDGRLPARRACHRSRRTSPRRSCSSTRSSTARRHQLQPGDVLVVGAGNSGAEIALEAVAEPSRPGWRAATRATFRSGSTALPARLLLTRLLLRVVFHRVLTIATPIGRKVRPKMLRGGAPLIRTKPKELTAAGVDAGPASRRRPERPAAARGRARARRRERRLVHRVHTRVLVDRPAGVRRSRGPAPRGRGRGRRAWALLRRAALPVCVLVRNDPRSGQGRRAHRRPRLGKERSG